MLDVNTPLSATPNKIVAPSNSNATSANNSSENLDSTISADQEYKDIALKLFNEEFVSIQPEEYTQFLAASDNESSRIREYYMDLFKWDSNLLKSTRTLCHKLYLKGESQEIDRILSSFTKSYIKQHPVNVFCTRNFEKIYIVLYSLILLNTALHNSEVNKKSKIGQTDYIRNTFTTFIQQNPKSLKKLSIKQRIIIERELSNYYEDLSKNELHLKKSDDFNNGNESTSSNTQSSQPSNTSSTAAAVNSISSNPPNQQLASNNNFANSLPQTINAPPSTQAANPDFSTPTESEFPTLTRQLSDTSIWSTDTNNNRRSSLGMKRMPSATSNVSQYTAVNTNNSTASGRTHRVGFTRALASDNKFYNNPNASRASSVNGTPYSLRNRHSLDQLRGMPSYQNTNYNNTPTQPNNTTNNGLNRRSSRASVISKESVGSINNDDTVSVLSFDTVHMNNFDIEGLDDRNKEPEPQQGLEDFNVEDYQDHYDLTLELQGSPYLKEGLLKLKILNNDQQDSNVRSSNNNHKQDANATSAAAAAAANAATSTHTGTNTSSLLPNKFNESFVVVSKGELALYSFDPKVIKKHQQKIRKLKQKQIVQMLEEEEDEDGVMGDGNWLKNAANIGSYNLCSTYAQLEKINGNTTGNSFAKKSIYWSLTFPKVSKKQPKKFIFEAGTKEIALEFINTCNFWASKITAIPTLEESISSIEYGWTNLDALIHRKDNFKKAKYIQKWEPLARGVYLSNYIVANSSLDNEANHLGMMKQFVKTLKYYNNLKKLYNEFNHTKVKFLRNFKQFANTSNYKIIIANYENKIIEYKSELNKYKTYLIILGFGLQLRFDLEQQDREAAILDQLENDPTLKEEGKDINEEATKLFIAQYEQDSELTQLVKFEIRKLFTSMKDVSKVIPTFQSSRSINNLIELTKQQQHQYAYYPMKSPKTFTLSNYNDNESPINQLLQTIDSNNHLHSGDKNDLMHSFSTNTIKEEEEPEESDDTKTANDYTISTKNNPSGETLQPSHVLK
ncbi:hypothetical protein HYPBUDRAFT_101716 [Hyphopichia burtonii NRRL Y-1933]|uniref:SEC7 domain-containing protein n=1 Tax=Hyphopichia burtonii NRRL Y-1933 TaxID=984485 RepID=A0A1E4RSE0_9ASCO|nr:hypothetical protein HYPBUDRAFT_101716 [Hyphopichia burtonii NRRL Y-1933]ODV70202.1 hypothetical protein HYPBUDRAFT_101716 [Hyphopichia burtonii NRRL Y-1933]